MRTAEDPVETSTGLELSVLSRSTHTLLRLRGEIDVATHCEHLDTVLPAPPLGSVCRACREAGDDWAGLFTCLTCGWVACSNGSPRRHARAHYEETDHPLARALRPGPAWRWCYVHQRAV